RLQTFCSEDLGAFYLDILKDRLYTTATDSHARRSAQTALYHITHALLRLLAPILSFTAEEAWKDFQQNPSQASIFTECYHKLPEVSEAPALVEKWDRLREIRAQVMRRIEEVRATGKIGSSLAANVTISADKQDHGLLASLNDDLRFVLI